MDEGGREVECGGRIRVGGLEVEVAWSWELGVGGGEKVVISNCNFETIRADGSKRTRELERELMASGFYLFIPLNHFVGF